MKTVLEYYDIYPKVLCTGRNAVITIKPLSRHVDFSEPLAYRVQLIPMNESLLNCGEERHPVIEAIYRDGRLEFSCILAREQQYAVRVQEQTGGDWTDRCELRIYALKPDYLALRPFRGDMHCHTCRSDGVESPDIVAANYRKSGYDFLSITDHGQYKPSLEAIHAYESLNLDFRLFPGEEVHPPENNSHTVHFGGEFSVNEAIRANPEQYRKEVREIADSLKLPASINVNEYASLLWVYKTIRKAGGLAIMAHPCWIQDYAYHLRRDMYRYMLETKPFDALELTCGQSLEENQQQISFWQQMREEGHPVPVVGSSDSHGTVNSDWFDLSKMIVFAEACEKNAIVTAVKDRRVAVLEQYRGEAIPRVYGMDRIVSLTLFLLTEYMPLHDELCVEEGRLMKEYANGSKAAGEALKQMKGRIPTLTNKYWPD